MQVSTFLAFVFLACVYIAPGGLAYGQKLQIRTTKRMNDCGRTSKKGDKLQMHYTGKLEDGTVFDSSIPRGKPFAFTLGAGEVIAGWDQGLLDMCEGEKRELVIPSDLAYGASGHPPVIPGGATLMFEVELLKIERDGGEQENRSYNGQISTNPQVDKYPTWFPQNWGL